MSEKIAADKFRDMGVKEIQRTINDQYKELRKFGHPAPGGGTRGPSQPDEDIGTIKRNIARGKTILNEKLDNQGGKS